MVRKQRILFIFVILALLLALPGTAFANKQIWKARLSTGAELHEVVGSSASGTLIIGTLPNGMPRFSLSVRGLSGAATGAHLHGPATDAQNGPVVVTLCGGPAPAVVATCTTDASGNLYIEGEISAGNLQGVTGAQFFSWLNDGLLYVNVHTALNPAGETRGQVTPQ